MQMLSAAEGLQAHEPGRTGGRGAMIADTILAVAVLGAVLAFGLLA